MINRELFQKIHDQISQYPGEHYQGTWESSGSCGTTRCVAGWAIHLTTGGPVYEGADPAGDVDWSAATVELFRRNGWGNEFQAGRDLLGLTPTQAVALFHHVDDETARDVVQAFAEGRDEDANDLLPHRSY